MVTHRVSTVEEICVKFDEQGETYEEQHGKAERLLSYRLGLFKQMAGFLKTDHVLDIGCGNGHHLRGLCDQFAWGTGIDFSPVMIDVAKERSQGRNLRFQQDDALKLISVADETIDVVICSGALEHMTDQRAVFDQIHRVLKRNGRFAILTLNGGYLWYKNIAPRLKIDTKHYSTDNLFSEIELAQLLAELGFTSIQIKPWTFIAKGDMPKWVAVFLTIMDHASRLFRLTNWRGGLQVYGKKRQT